MDTAPADRHPRSSRQPQGARINRTLFGLPQASAPSVHNLWQSQVAMMLQGNYPQNRSYRPWMPVDVRDNAACHVGLLESVQVRSGERYLAWSAERHDVEAISRRIRRLLPELGLAEPVIDDDHPEEIKAREAELRAIWARCDLRNDRVRAVTGVRFRPFDESLRDCVESLLAVGQVQPRLA